MATLDLPTGSASAQHDGHVKEAVSAPAPVTGFLHGDPAMLGLPSFIVGSLALGLVLIGMVPAIAVGASLPIILTATSVGMLITAVWAAGIGQSAVAGINGIFAGFYMSYAALVLGLTHGWFGITPAAILSTQKLFLTSWLIVVVMLTLATLRLPMAYTALFTLVDVTLLLALLANVQASANMSKAAGYVVLVFCAIGAYLFFGTASEATGGKPLPLGRPILHS